MSETEPHISPLSTYLAVFGALMVFTALTVGAAFIHLGHPWSDLVAMSIAIIKATLVVLFFMHVKYGTKMVKIIVSGAVLWLLLMFGITLSDYVSRTWVS